MRIAMGIVFSSLALLYAGQVASLVDFEWAQRHRLQEGPEHTDPLANRLELWTARWDTLWTWTLPAAGLLMLLDHSWWPYAAMIGGGTWVDTGGRELVKVLGLRDQAVRVGTTVEFRNMKVFYWTAIALGLLAIVAGLIEAT